jgi:hypothetical protein
MKEKKLSSIKKKIAQKPRIFTLENSFIPPSVG